MTGPEHGELGELLAGVVPQLPEPADRAGEVRARVRRQRRTRASISGVLALGVVLAVGIPTLVFGNAENAPPPADAVAPMRGLDGNDCPRRTGRHDYELAPEADPPERFVPEAAAEVMLCAVGYGSGFHVLRTGTDRLVDALNALPADDEETGTLGCNLADYPTQYWLILRYPAGNTTVVYVDQNCDRSVVVDGHARHGNVLGEFERLYRDQRATAIPDPSQIPTPECAATIEANRLNLDSPTFGPGPELIERPDLGDAAQPALTNPLVAATACGYRLDEDSHDAVLAATHQDRGDLSGLRSALNETWRIGQTIDNRRYSECGDEPADRVATPDVIVVADELGGTAEFWVYDNPGCYDLVRGHTVSLYEPVLVAAPAGVVTYLQDTLGP